MDSVHETTAKPPKTAAKKTTTPTGSQAIVQMFREAGVDTVFGLCGDTSLPFYEALLEARGSIRHILTRDERGASYMADAYARLSGRVGICEGPSGGGATYILPGVAEANGSSVPLIALTSDIDARDEGKNVLTELDQTALFTPVTREAFYPAVASQIPGIVRRAFRKATTGRQGATHITLPFNSLEGDVGDAALDIDARYATYPAHRVAPDPEAIRQAAKVLGESRRPLLVASAGAIRSGAWEEVTRLAHYLGAPVATSIGGKGSISELDPYALGVIGSNGGLPYRHDVVRQADVVFYIGSGTGSVTTEKWSLPARSDATFLQLDIDPDELGRNYPLAVGIVADAKLGLSALLDELQQQFGDASLGKVDPAELEARRATFMQSVAHHFESAEAPIRPERLLHELFDVMPDDSIVLADPGTPCPYFSAYWRLPKPGRWFVSPRAHGALGYALPAVVGAYFARPDAGRIIGVMGDGSFGISTGDLETIARLNIPVTLIVTNNASYGWIKAGQKSRGGHYYSVDFSATDNAAVAAAFGLTSKHVEDPADLRPALRAALTSEGPYLLDVRTQPLEEANAPVSKWIA